MYDRTVRMRRKVTAAQEKPLSRRETRQDGFRDEDLRCLEQARVVLQGSKELVDRNQD